MEVAGEKPTSSVRRHPEIGRHPPEAKEKNLRLRTRSRERQGVSRRRENLVSKKGTRFGRDISSRKTDRLNIEALGRPGHCRNSTGIRNLSFVCQAPFPLKTGKSRHRKKKRSPCKKGKNEKKNTTSDSRFAKGNNLTREERLSRIFVGKSDHHWEPRGRAIISGAGEAKLPSHWDRLQKKEGYASGMPWATEMGCAVPKKRVN